MPIDVSPFVLDGRLSDIPRARELAGQLGPACVPKLLLLLQHGSQPMAWWAFEALAKLAPERIEEWALPVLKGNGDNEVRGAAAAALGAGRSRASLELLLASLGDRSYFVQHGAHDALILRTEPGASAAIVAALHGQTAHRTELLRILGRRADETSLRAFREVLDTNPQAGLAFEVAEGRNDPQAVALLWDLTNHLAHRGLRADALIRLAAIEAVDATELLPALERGTWQDSYFRGDAATAEDLWLRRGALQTALTRVVARVLRESSDPEAIYARLASFVRPAHADAIFEHIRNTAILAAVHEAIVAAQAGAGVLPSPSWRGPSAELAMLHSPMMDGVDAAEEIAGSVVRAFSWLAGEFDPGATVTRVKLDLYVEEPWPLVVVGFWLDADAFEAVREFASPGIHAFRHTYGGIEGELVTVVGIPFALSEDAVTGIDGRGETGTFGEPADLAPWNELAAELGWPTFTSGFEGIVATDPIAALPPHLDAALKFCANERPWDAIDWDGLDPSIERAPIDWPCTHANLVAFAAAHGFGEPRMILLWGDG